MTNQAEIALYANLVLNVHESQEVFRTLLNALSQPGTIHHLPQTLAHRFIPALAPLAALVSHDVPFSVCGGESVATSIAVERATFGRSVEPEFAVFIAALTGHVPDAGSIRRGSAHRPDGGCQISYQISGRLVPGTTEESILSIAGPGVPTVRSLSVEWATDELSSLQSLLKARSDSWPMGFDIWLVDDFGQVVGIPRTSNITGVMAQHDERVSEH
jgi:phosphonate C-P lyase system protein PhnH